MHWLLFIHKILFSSTCFEPQLLIFRRIQLYTCSIWYLMLHVYNLRVGLRAGLDRCGKSRPTGIRSADRPARRQSLYRLRYPAHLFSDNVEKYCRTGQATSWMTSSWPSGGCWFRNRKLTHGTWNISTCCVPANSNIVIPLSSDAHNVVLKCPIAIQGVHWDLSLWTPLPLRWSVQTRSLATLLISLLFL